MEHLKTPQLEHGHTRVAHELLLKLAGACTNSGTQAGIMLVVMRFSYGYQRKKAYLTISEFADHLGTGRKNVRASLEALQARKMLIITTRPGHHRKAYQVQKDWRLWGWCKKDHGAKCTSGAKGTTRGCKEDHLGGAKCTTSKITKIITKKGGDYVLE